MIFDLLATSGIQSGIHVPLIFPPAILSHPEFNGLTSIPRAVSQEISKRREADKDTCALSIDFNFEI
jgi:hypothetical protein